MSAKCQKRTLGASGYADRDRDCAPALKQAVLGFIDWILPTGPRVDLAPIVYASLLRAPTSRDAGQ